MSLSKEYSVYKHTSPSNKVYIGITNQKVERRWRNGNGYMPRDGRPTPFSNAIIKYGWDNFRHEVLANGLSCEDACHMEIDLIKQYKSDNRKFGYNVLKGGSVPLAECPESVKEHMRESSYRKWEKPDYIDSHSGDNHWTKKKGYSSKSIEAMRKATLGMKRTPEQVEFLREKGRNQKRAYGRDNKTSKPVICLSLDGKELRHYGGMMEASRETGATFQGISLVCRGKQQTAGGYKWRYENEEGNKGL